MRGLNGLLSGLKPPRLSHLGIHAGKICAKENQSFDALKPYLQRVPYRRDSQISATSEDRNSSGIKKFYLDTLVKVVKKLVTLQQKSSLSSEKSAANQIGIAKNLLNTVYSSI